MLDFLAMESDVKESDFDISSEKTEFILYESDKVSKISFWDGFLSTLCQIS